MKLIFKTIEDETVELDVLERELIVKIKQKIRDNLLCPKNINVKFMKLKHNNIILNDNDCLLPCDRKFGEINVVLQSELESRNNIILLFQGDIEERQILQLPKDTTIEKVKELLKPNKMTKKFDLYRHSEELRDEITIEHYGLIDYTRINVVEEETESDDILKIQKDLKEIFNGQPEEYFKRKTQKRFRRKNDYLMLFHEKTHQLNPFSRTFYNLQKLIINPLNIPGIKIENEPFELGMFSEIYLSRDEKNNRSMVIKRYICEDGELLTKYEKLIEDMISFQKNNHNSKVVELYSFYRNEFSFGVGMELMEGGSLDNYVKYFWPFPEKQISRWTRSIAEGLQYLHNNKIIFRDLKPSNILLDENNNLKLCSFSLSIFLMSNHDMELKRSSGQSRMGLYNYIAPEVLNSGPYSFSADIWAFGGILVFMITGKHPCPDKDPIDAAFQIAHNKTMLYTLPDSTNEIFKSTISKCVTEDPKSRPTITELIEHHLAPLLT